MITCKFEDGSDANLRHVVVDAIVVNAVRDAIMLVKRAPHLSNGDKYAMIGGYLDRDETTDQAILRELKEETGYEGAIVERYAVVDNPNRRGEDRQNVSFVYIVQAGELTGTRDSESSEVRWFRFNDLPQPEEFAFDHFDTISTYLQEITTDE